MPELGVPITPIAPSTSLLSIFHVFFLLCNKALHVKSAGDAPLLLGGALVSPLYTLLVVLGGYILWLPFGALFSFIASFLTTPGTLILLVLMCMKCGKFVARMMVFPGSIPYFSLSMEREYASRLRGGLLLTLKNIEAALLKTAKCSRKCSASERRDLLAAINSLQLPSKVTTTSEDLDLLSAPASRPLPKIVLPGISSASSPHSLMTELIGFYTALLAHRRAALVGGAVRAQIHPGIPWGTAIIGEGWSQHSAITLHYTETSLKLIGAVCGALSRAAHHVAHDIDLLSDPMPIEGGSPVQNLTLTCEERATLGSINSLDLLLSPAPFEELKIGEDTSKNNMVESMSLTLTLAAALASIKRLAVVLPWLELVPHYGFGSSLAAREVAEVFFKDISSNDTKNESTEEVSSATTHSSLSPPLPHSFISALERASRHVQRISSLRRRGLNYIVFQCKDWLVGFFGAVTYRLAATIGFTNPMLISPSPSSSSSVNESFLPPVPLAASHLSPVAHSLGLSPLDLQTALALISPQHVLGEGIGGGVIISGANLQDEAHHQSLEASTGSMFFPAFLPPFLLKVWATLTLYHSFLIKAIAASSIPSPVAGHHFLRAEASYRGDSASVRIPLGLKGTGEVFSSSWEGRFVDALLIPAGSGGSAWTGGNTFFAPSRDVTIEDISIESDSQLIEREKAVYSHLLGEKEDIVPVPSPLGISFPQEPISASTPLPQSSVSSSSLCRRRGPGSSPQGYNDGEGESKSPLGPDFHSPILRSPWGSQQKKDVSSKCLSGSFCDWLRCWIPCCCSSPATVSFPDWNPPSTQHLDAFRTAYLKSPSRTLVIMCPPNAGLWETSLRHHEAARFYTQVIGADVLLWNYVGYGRPVGGSSSRSTEGYRFSDTLGSLLDPSSPSSLGSGPSPMSIRKDALSLIAWARSTLAPNSIIVHGESLGGCAAAAIAREGSAEVVIVDRSFDDLGRTASYVVGQWARPALDICTGWARGMTPSGEDIAASLSSSSPLATSFRLKLVVVANDAHDTVISSPCSLTSTLANAIAYSQTVEGRPLPSTWGKLASPPSFAFLSLMNCFPITAVKNALMRVRGWWHRLRVRGSAEEELSFSHPYSLPAPSALVSLHPLMPDVAVALHRLSVRLNAFLLYLTHETTWAPYVIEKKQQQGDSAVAAIDPTSLSTLMSEENIHSMPPLSLSQISSWEWTALRNRLAFLSLSGTPPQSCARAAASTWALGETSFSSPVSSFTLPVVEVNPISLSATTVETLRPPILSKEIALGIIGASSSLALQFERDMERKALELAARHVPSQLSSPIRSLLVNPNNAAGGEISSGEVALASLGTVDSCVTASEISAALNDAPAFSSWLASPDSPLSKGIRGASEEGGAPTDKVQSWANPILVAFAGLNNGLGERCGEALSSGGVHAVKTWLAGGLLWGWQEDLKNVSSSPTPVLNYARLKVKAKDASRAALLARASASSHPSGALSIVLSTALTNRSVFTSLARESNYLNYQPSVSMTSQAERECAWTATATAGLPWSSVEVALQRVREANPLSSFQKQGENTLSPNLLHSHRSRVWGEAQGILEDLQMLRARVAESKEPKVKLDVSFEGVAPNPSLATVPPQLLVLPLTCGHNLPWMPAESAILACALREALKL